VAEVGTSNQDGTISLKAAVRSCINKPDYDSVEPKHVAVISIIEINGCVE